MSSFSKQIKKQNEKYRLDNLTTKMRVLYTNVQGLINNYNQIEIIAATEKPKFLILSETSLTKDIDDKEISLQGYDNIGSVSTSSRTDGIIVYCNSVFTPKFKN